MKLVLICIVSILTGIATGWWFWGRHYDDRSAKYHWSKVEEYREFVRDPKNYEKQGRFSVATNVPRVEVHLAALVQMRELIRREVIIPNLRNDRKYIRKWKEFGKQPGIVHGTAPGDYETGEIPLIFTIWHTNEAEGRVQEFIAQLEAEADHRKPGGEQDGER